MEDLNAALKQDEEKETQMKQEVYWNVVMNPVSENVMYQMYKEKKSQEYQSPTEVPSEKPTLLEVMERFRGKNLFPEATERTRTYLERMGFNNMPHPNPMSPIVETEEEKEREALMARLKSQIDDIKEKGV
jgi:hypothetical protein